MDATTGWRRFALVCGLVALFGMAATVPAHAGDATKSVTHYAKSKSGCGPISDRGR